MLLSCMQDVIFQEELCNKNTTLKLCYYLISAIDTVGQGMSVVNPGLFLSLEEVCTYETKCHLHFTGCHIYYTVVWLSKFNFFLDLFKGYEYHCPASYVIFHR